MANGIEPWFCRACGGGEATARPARCPWCGSTDTVDGSNECDDCDGSGTYYIDGEPQVCICAEPQVD